MADSTPKLIERIVCLANSRKTTGRCIAGKRVGDNRWVRPVSDRPGHEISEFDRRYENGEMARIFDVIDIPCIERQPRGYQSENVLMDDQYYWVRKGRATWENIQSLVDRGADLWANGYSAYSNKSNRVPEHLLDPNGGSLRLIPLDRVELHAGPKAPQFNNTKFVVRARFDYRGDHYSLDVTDPVIESDLLRLGSGDYPLQDVVACVSLSEIWQGYAYKLVAAIITEQRASQ